MGTIRAVSLTTGKNRSLTAVWANALLSPLSSAHGTTDGCGIPTVAKTVAKPLDGARRMWTTLEYRPSLRPVTDGPGRLAHCYGLEGRGTPVHPGLAAPDPLSMGSPPLVFYHPAACAGTRRDLPCTSAGEPRTP